MQHVLAFLLKLFNFVFQLIGTSMLKRMFVCFLIMWLVLLKVGRFLQCYVLQCAIRVQVGVYELQRLVL